MEKKKKVIGLIVLIFSIVLVAIVFISSKLSNMEISKSKLISQDNVFYKGKVNGSFIEISLNGDIYEHDFRGNSVCIEKSTDIIFLKDNEIANSEYKQLTIKKNGDIYVCDNNNYEGEKIGTISGAVSGAISKNHVVVVTDVGELYVYGENENGALGLGGIKKTSEFTKIKNIPLVKKVICENQYTFFLSYSGEVFGCGKIEEKITYNVFTKFNIPNKVSDIDCYYKTIIAIDMEGYIYELGEDIYNSEFHNQYLEFKKIEEKSFKYIAQGEDCIIRLDKVGNIFYSGGINRGKSYRESMKGRLYGKYNVEKLLCSGRYIFFINNGEVVRVKLK